ncbi:MAG: hypothetical protein K1X44_06560 [Alphaproteobacteria bacterium]|nr:hypothetical protein [Alphaproteobacteria bacterium]
MAIRYKPKYESVVRQSVNGKTYVGYYMVYKKILTVGYKNYAKRVTVNDISLSTLAAKKLLEILYEKNIIR